MYEFGWNELPQVKFWQSVIQTDADFHIANVYSTRQILEKIPSVYIDSLDKEELTNLKKQMCIKYGLDTLTKLLFTSGKKWFYNYSDIKLQLKEAINTFESLDVDPFYAQSVLLIESPRSQNSYSKSGAYGMFQLMPGVARQFGLTVNKYVDERSNFYKSATASANLFKTTCVPYASRWLTENGFEVDQKALWFKLIALHVYNAGATTVKHVIAQVPKNLKGMEITQYLWKSNVGRFQNESQNYSQIAIACYLEYEKIMLQNTYSHYRDINF